MALSWNNYSSGEIFEQGGKYYQIIAEETSVNADTPLTDPAIAELDPADVTFSLLTHEAGEIFQQGDNFYRNLSEVSVPAGASLDDETSFQRLDSSISWEDHRSGEIFEQGGKFYKTIADETVPTGALLSDENFFKTLDPANILSRRSQRW